VGPVTLVCGDDTPGTCGVVDYTHRLAESLASLGADVELVGSSRGSLDDVPRGRRQGIVHLQYPCRSFGSSLIPLASAARRWAGGAGRPCTFVTIHEYRLAHPLRKAVNRALGRLAEPLFTCESELDAFGGRPSRWQPIPVGSNLSPGGRTLDQRLGSAVRTLICFGRLDHRPSDLAKVIDLAGTLVDRRPDVVVVLVGSAAPQWRPPSPLPPNVELVASPTAAELDSLFDRADAALQWYADGAGERRTTLMAMLASGVPALTNHGPATPQWLRRCTHDISSGGLVDALDALEHALRPGGPLDVGQPVRVETEARMRQRAWPAIAAEHLLAYRTLTEAPR
jgi:hypothetical protein